MAPPPSVQMVMMTTPTAIPKTPTVNFYRQQNRISRMASLQRSPSSMFLMDPRTLATRYLVRPRVGYDNRFRFTDPGSGGIVGLFIWLKDASEKWFSHFFLLLALIIYAIIGGAIFHHIEGSFEQEQNVCFVLFVYLLTSFKLLLID